MSLVANILSRLFARRHEPFPELPEITLRPIGIVRSAVKETKPPDFDWGSVLARIHVRPDLEDALLGLDTYSHVQVIFWPHLVPANVIGSKHRLYPRDDPSNPLQGILATRSQIRFNPLLVTAALLISVKRNIVSVRGLDAVDGTPVLDLKPYIARFDAVPDARVPAWVTGATDRPEAAGQ